MSANAIAELLRASVTAGEFGPLADAYTDDVALDASLPGSRRRVHGPAEAVATLGACFRGPGRLIEWDAAIDPAGIAVWLERVGDDGGAVRQRQYLHIDPSGRIGRHWIYTARPRTAPSAEPVPEAAEQLFAGLGEIAERTTLASSGWSGNRIDRLVLADGRELIAKRIVPGSDWLGRAIARPRTRGAAVLRWGVRAHARGRRPGHRGRGARR